MPEAAVISSNSGGPAGPSDARRAAGGVPGLDRHAATNSSRPPSTASDSQRRIMSIPCTLEIQGGGASHPLSSSREKFSNERRGESHPQSLFTQPRIPLIGGSPEPADEMATSPRRALTWNLPDFSVLVNEYVTRRPSRENSAGTVPFNSWGVPSTSAVPWNASPEVPVTSMVIAFFFGRADQRTPPPTSARATRRAARRAQRLATRRLPITLSKLTSPGRARPAPGGAQRPCTGPTPPDRTGTRGWGCYRALNITRGHDRSPERGTRQSLSSRFSV